MSASSLMLFRTRSNFKVGSDAPGKTECLYQDGASDSIGRHGKAKIPTNQHCSIP